MKTKNQIICAMTALSAIFATDLECQEVLPKQNNLSAEQILTLNHKKHDKPFVLIIGDNKGTETTDLMIPYGILKSSNLFDVKIAAPKSTAITMMPSFKIIPDISFEQFETEHPEGADIVIIPAIHNKDSKIMSDFVLRQSRKGAFSVSICEGAWVLAQTNIPNNSFATTHWYAKPKISAKYKQIIWNDNIRYVGGKNYVTTSGVSASMPISLALVEVFGGTELTKSIADKYSVADWSDRHDTSQFKFDKSFYGPIIENALSFWTHETIYSELDDGFDEIPLAINADAWSRTYKSKFYLHCKNDILKTKNGMQIVCDNKKNGVKVEIDNNYNQSPFDNVLDKIKARYNTPTSDLVRIQLEYNKSK